MFQQFYHQCKQLHYWQVGQKILLAVSGGADSMVLLHLMEKAAEKDQLLVAVVHVNHQLRKESDAEAAYIEAYCHDHGLTYYSKKWLDYDKSNNTEARARKFRYDFFATCVKQGDYDLLMTAHHCDDQAETLLLKVTRGSAFHNLVGIRAKQPFSTGNLVRPLLSFSKEQIKQFAKQTEIVYFEDTSNQSDQYARNRLRHQVVPVLKKENPQFLQHIQDISEQVALANEVIQTVIEPKYIRWVTETKEGWRIQLTELKKETKSVQLFFIQILFQKTLIPKGVHLGQTHTRQLLSMIRQPAPQVQMDLEQQWQIKKAYDWLYLEKKTLQLDSSTFSLHVGEASFLSEYEWMGLEAIQQPLNIPLELHDWHESALLISRATPLPIRIRHRKHGDRIALTPKLTKKLNRLFIDKKIPNHRREQAWVVSGQDGEIIWVPQFANSYLSIPKETDKILYRLLYKTKE